MLCISFRVFLLHQQRLVQSFGSSYCMFLSQEVNALRLLPVQYIHARYGELRSSDSSCWWCIFSLSGNSCKCQGCSYIHDIRFGWWWRSLVFDTQGIWYSHNIRHIYIFLPGVVSFSGHWSFVRHWRNTVVIEYLFTYPWRFVSCIYCYYFYIR